MRHSRCQRVAQENEEERKDHLIRSHKVLRKTGRRQCFQIQLTSVQMKTCGCGLRL
jgi:hypothetical protein